jgi:hypothetical protein
LKLTRQLGQRRGLGLTELRDEIAGLCLKTGNFILRDTSVVA